MFLSDKLAQDVALHTINYLIEEMGIEYAVAQKPEDPTFYHISFMEGGKEFFHWQTWENTRFEAIKVAFLQLVGVGMIAKFPDNFQFKEQELSRIEKLRMMQGGVNE